MDSKTIQEMLPDYVRGLLNKEKSRIVQENLERSGPLCKEYEELRTYYRALETLEPVKASNTFMHAVHSRIGTPLLLSQLIKKIFTPLPVKLPLELAGLAVTVAIVVLVYNPFSSRKIAPVVFDESAMQGKKAPVDISSVEGLKEEAIEGKEEIGMQEPVKKRLVEAKVKKSAAAPQKQKKTPSVMTSQFAVKKEAAPGMYYHDTKGKKETAEKDAYEGTAQEAPAEMEELALAKPASIPIAGAAGAMLMDEEEQFAANVIKRSDSIVMQTKMPQPEIDDVGLLALSISARKRDKEPVRKIQELKTKKARLSRREKKVLKKKSNISYSYDDSEIAPAKAIPPSNEVTFATIEKKITSHNGSFSLMDDKPQTPDKKYYFIEIPREQFSAFLKELESEGEVSDEKFSLETSKTERIRFNLIISIE